MDDEEEKDLAMFRPKGALNAQSFAEQLKTAAQKTTGNNLYNSGLAMKAELDKLGNLIAERTNSVVIVAPLKGRKRAEEKVHTPKEGHEDEAGDWFQLKDMARITLCPNTETTQAVEVVGKLLEKLMENENVTGYGKVKGEETKANLDACGYSGWNFVLRFGALSVDPNHAENTVNRIALSMGLPGPTRPRSSSEPPPLPTARPPSVAGGFNDNLLSHHLAGNNRFGKEKIALDTLGKPQFNHVGRYGEIQVNTVPMLYAKMSNDDFKSMFGEQKYAACFARFGVIGGLGHVFYEHWRSEKATPRAKEAAALSKQYYGRMRGTDIRPPDPRNDMLKSSLEAYVQRFGTH